MFERGDCSADWIKATCAGEDYDEEMSPAKAKFFQAASEMALEVSNMDYDKQLQATRGLVHVFLNALGMTYLEEATFCRHYADNAIELMKKYYRM